MGLVDFNRSDHTWCFYFGSKNRKLKKRKDALKILPERYAKGKITKEEYIERKETFKTKK